MQEVQHLIDRFPVVCLIDKTVKLGGGGPKASYYLALCQRTLLNSFLGSIVNL